MSRDETSGSAARTPRSRGVVSDLAPVTALAGVAALGVALVVGPVTSHTLQPLVREPVEVVATPDDPRSVAVSSQLPSPAQGLPGTAPTPDPAVGVAETPDGFESTRAARRARRAQTGGIALLDLAPRRGEGITVRLPAGRVAAGLAPTGASGEPLGPTLGDPVAGPPSRAVGRDGPADSAPAPVAGLDDAFVAAGGQRQEAVPEAGALGSDPGPVASSEESVVVVQALAPGDATGEGSAPDVAAPGPAGPAGPAGPRAHHEPSGEQRVQSADRPERGDKREGTGRRSRWGLGRRGPDASPAAKGKARGNGGDTRTRRQGDAAGRASAAGAQREPERGDGGARKGVSDERPEKARGQRQR